VAPGLDSNGHVNNGNINNIPTGRYTGYPPTSSLQQQSFNNANRILNSITPGMTSNSSSNSLNSGLNTPTSNGNNSNNNSNYNNFNSKPPNTANGNSNNHPSTQYGTAVGYGDAHNRNHTHQNTNNTSDASMNSTTNTMRRQDANRVDPSQMPHPDKPLYDVVYHTRSGSGRRNPPSGNSIYTAIDTGNCIPRHMRATLVAPPVNKALLDKTGLPFAIIATPFAPVERDEAPIPTVDLGPLPPRCTRCNGYVNPSVSWGDNGNEWTCNLCSMVNATPDWYYCSLDGAGHRMDRSSRPELQLGSVDFLVNDDYCVRPLQDPIHVFAIDISHKAVANGVTIASIRSVRAALLKLRQLEEQYGISSSNSAVDEALRAAAYSANATTKAINKTNTKNSANNKTTSNGSTSIRAAIVTFNHNIQYYTVNMASAEPIKMFEVSGEDPLCPLPPDLFLMSVSSADTALEHLLQRIPELVASMQGASEEGYDRYNYSGGINNNDGMSQSTNPKKLSRNMSGTGFGGSSPRGTTPRNRPASGAYDAPSPSVQDSSTSESPNCLAGVIKSLQEALHSIGGRVVVVSASHATSGYGRLSRGREKVNLYGTKEEISLYGYGSTVIQGASLGVRDTAVTALSSAATLIGATAGSASSVHASKLQQQNTEQADDMKRLCTLYRDLAVDCARSTVCVSIVACVGEDVHDGGPFFDTALIGEITTLTGGQLHFFAGALSLEDNVVRLEQQLVGCVAQIAASEAIVKVRTSVGLRVDKVLSAGVYNTVRSEVECCGVDTHTTFMFALTYDSALKEDERVHYQLAVLHTTPCRKRKIRVHNLTTIASPKPTIVFRNCDIEAVVVALLKEGVDRALICPLSEENAGVRGYLDNAVANSLFKYRMHCSPASPKGQLVLPDSLKVMPIYTLSMLKHPAILENRSALGTASPSAASSVTQSLMSNSNTDTSKLAFIPTYGSALSRVAVRAHERAYELRKLLTCSLVECINSIYPRMYNISTLFRDVYDDETLLKLSSSYDDAHKLNSSSEEFSNFSNESIEVSEEYMMGASTNSVSFNNLLGRNAIGLQLNHPSNTKQDAAAAGLASPSQETSVNNTSAILIAQLSKKLIHVLCPTAEVFEADQMYLLDDRSTLYLYVGRNVPAALIDEIMDTSPGNGGLGRKESVTFRLDSELGRRIQLFCDLLRSTNNTKQDLKVVWAELAPNSPVHNKFSARLIEDSNLGLMSYVDYLCNMHIKIQAKIK